MAYRQDLVDLSSTQTLSNKTVTGTAYPSTIAFSTGTGSDILYDQNAPTDGWTDIPIEITVKGSGVNDPSFTVFRNGIQAYEFVGTPDGAMRQVWGTIHIPHQITPGTGIYFHIHWAPNAASSSGNVKFNFEYTYASSGSAFPATQTVSVVQAMPAQYTHTITEIAAPVLTGSLEVDGNVLVRMYRNPADVQDTSTNSAFVFLMDCHVNISKFATKYRNKATGSFYQ